MSLVFASVGDFHYLGWAKNPDHTRIEGGCETAAARKPTMVENSELRKAGSQGTLPRVKILQMLDTTDRRHMSRGRPTRR